MFAIDLTIQEFYQQDSYLFLSSQSDLFTWQTFDHKHHLLQDALDKEHNSKYFFLFQNQRTCLAYSPEPSQWRFWALNCNYFLIHNFEHVFWMLKRTISMSSLEYPKHVRSLLRNNKIIFNYRLLSGCLIFINTNRRVSFDYNIIAGHFITELFLWLYDINHFRMWLNFICRFVSIIFAFM